MRTAMLISIFIFTIVGIARAEVKSSLKELKPTEIYIYDSEDEEDFGFGDEEANARMMGLMMVEGSAYEGMSHAHHHK